jgi:3-deoxy-D-manno-octulosonate 8-phosphate phosphatase (KDO 8-P phosphatase)
MKSYKESLKNITCFIFDVDGVLTDGQVLMLNDDFYRSLNSKDAYALQYAAKNEYQIYIITGGNSEDVKKRLLGLGVKDVFLKSSNKLEVYNEIKLKNNLKDEEILYMGDDIPDFQVMKTCGIATCPQDACPEIKAISHYQSPYFGGKGCVRDVIEQVLRVQNKWFLESAMIW